MDFKPKKLRMYLGQRFYEEVIILILNRSIPKTFLSELCIMHLIQNEENVINKELYSEMWWRRRKKIGRLTSI